MSALTPRWVGEPDVSGFPPPCHPDGGPVRFVDADLTGCGRFASNPWAGVCPGTRGRLVRVPSGLGVRASDALQATRAALRSELIFDLSSADC